MENFNTNPENFSFLRKCEIVCDGLQKLCEELSEHSSALRSTENIRKAFSEIHAEVHQLESLESLGSVPFPVTERLAGIISRANCPGE